MTAKKKKKSMSTNRITSLGLEVEGGWSPGASCRGSIKHDGSVRSISNDTYLVGEISSEPLPDLENCEKWLKANYPQHVNESCGLHVHVSLPPLHYSRLMSPQFETCFLNAMEEFWSRFRSEPAFDLFRHRLDGQNQYCQKVFRPEDQIWRREHYGDRTGSAAHPRYSQLNFCFGRHGTMECRLFPCFPLVSHSIEATKAFVNCINEFLATCAPEKPIQFTVVADMETQPNGPRALATAA